MDPDKSKESSAPGQTAETEALPRKPYDPPRLTTYGHISKLTTGSSGTKKDGGTKRRCL